MFPGWGDNLSANRHLEELRRQADAERMVRLARASTERRPWAPYRLMTWLGHRLEIYGRRLAEAQQMPSDPADCRLADC